MNLPPSDGRIQRLNRPMRQQTILEYLLNYGWAILIITIIFATLWALGLFNPTAFANSSCIFSEDFSCLNNMFTPNGNVIVNLQQSTAAPINITAIGCNTNKTATHMKSISPADYLNINGNITFYVQCYASNGKVFSGLSGSVYQGYLVLNYTDLQTGFKTTSYGDLLEKVGTNAYTLPTSSTFFTTTSTTTTSTSTTSTSTTSTSTSSTSSSSTSTSSTSTTSTSTTSTSLVPIFDTNMVFGGDNYNSPLQTPAFTTSYSNDMILAVVTEYSTAVTPSVTDTAGLTWTEEYSASSGCYASYWFYALPHQAVTNDKVTATAAGASDLGILIAAFDNANSFDSSVNYIGNNNIASGIVTLTYSSTNSNEVLIGYGDTCILGGSPSWTTGPNVLEQTTAQYALGYVILNKVQSSQKATFTWDNDVDEAIVALSMT